MSHLCIWRISERTIPKNGYSSRIFSLLSLLMNILFIIIHTRYGLTALIKANGIPRENIAQYFQNNNSISGCYRERQIYCRSMAKKPDESPATRKFMGNGLKGILLPWRMGFGWGESLLTRRVIYDSTVFEYFLRRREARDWLIPKALATLRVLPCMVWASSTSFRCMASIISSREPPPMRSTTGSPVAS